MAYKNLFATIFVFSCVLTCKGDDCETYDGNGLCVPPCKDGKVLYSAGCEDPTMSERTCRDPKSRSLGVICDYSRCDCLAPKVWDECAKKCVKFDECSDQSALTNKSN